MISAIVLTKNEGENIQDCLEGLKWCDEILVIDDNSTDETAKLAKKSGAKVILHSLNNDFGAQRNFALEKAKEDWVFFVDADERVSPELTREIQKEIIKNNYINGYYFHRLDNFMGKFLKHGEIGGIGEKSILGEIGEFGGEKGFGRMKGLTILRLAKRGSGQWERRVEETWQIQGKTKTFINPLLHYSHPNLNQFLENINMRTTLNAQAFYTEGKKVSSLDWLKPLAKFVWNYFFRLGFLDGIEGFVFAVLMSLHSFLVRGKLYLLWQKEGK
ncbi:MAG: glycosyltransferase family 2 protein [Patescibacteria group bacterium]|nr:glycosyltransferase family 2 protein [Patescibacteria group bacterium]